MSSPGSVLLALGGETYGAQCPYHCQPRMLKGNASGPKNPSWDALPVSGMANGRCRLHGGLSTEPKTAERIERIGPASAMLRGDSPKQAEAERAKYRDLLRTCHQMLAGLGGMVATHSIHHSTGADSPRMPFQRIADFPSNWIVEALFPCLFYFGGPVVRASPDATPVGHPTFSCFQPRYAPENTPCKDRSSFCVSPAGAADSELRH